MSGPLRWLVLATHVGPDGSGGGIVRWTVEFLRALRNRPDIDVHVLAHTGTRSFMIDEIGLSATQFHEQRPMGTLGDSLAIASGWCGRARMSEFDVVHGPKHVMPIRSSACRVLTVHDLVLFDRPDDFGRLKRVLLPVPHRAALRSADLLVCISEATRQRLVELLPQTSPRAVVVRAGISSRLTGAIPAGVPELLDTRFALIVGDMSPRKNVRHVVSLWPEVAARVSDVKLVLVGPPNWGRDDVGGQIHELIERGHAVHLGHVSDRSLRWLYENAAMVLLPSLSEGYGLPAAEAVAFGAPLVRSLDPALAEAAQGLGVAIDASDSVAWREAIVGAFATGRARSLTAPSGTWASAASSIVEAVRATVREPGPDLADRRLERQT